jgi:hypothetical protein
LAIVGGVDEDDAVGQLKRFQQNEAACAAV